jgi:hypothetical protein
VFTWLNHNKKLSLLVVDPKTVTPDGSFTTTKRSSLVDSTAFSISLYRVLKGHDYERLLFDKLIAMKSISFSVPKANGFDVIAADRNNIGYV